MLHVDAHGTNDGQALQEAERRRLHAMAGPKKLVVTSIARAVALQEVSFQRRSSGNRARMAEEGEGGAVGHWVVVRLLDSLLPSSKGYLQIKATHESLEVMVHDRTRQKKTCA